jgi:hypothetical protein
MIRQIGLILLLTLGFHSYGQKSLDYNFIANYYFADKVVSTSGMVLLNNGIYKFGTIGNDSDTSWSDNFKYKVRGHEIFLNVGDKEYLQYSNRIGDNVFSITEYELDTSSIPSMPSFIVSKFIDDYLYNSKKCYYFENAKLTDDHSKFVIVCIFDKSMKLPIYYEISIYKFDNLTSRVIHFLR